MRQVNRNIIQLAEEVSESGRCVSSSQERETTLSSRVNEREGGKGERYFYEEWDDDSSWEKNN
jgi:quinol monooxygenase YgiN